MVYFVENKELNNWRVCIFKKNYNMEPLPFIFSSRLKWRLARHLCFWLCWYLFQVFLYSFAPSPILTKLGFWARIQVNTGESFAYMMPHLFLSYTLMYWVIPKMVIPARYVWAAVAVIILVILTGALSAFISIDVVESLRQKYFTQYGAVSNSQTRTPGNVILYMAFLSGLRGSITIGGLAAAIKLMKYFYDKQQQALSLEQQRTVAELQSLKAQLHPHFLFNTLNNIYSHTQDIAPVASDMVLQLSGLLRYILYSCNAPLVPLEKEVAMIQEYIELEKKRYGNQLEIAMQTPDDYNGLLVSPLLILPFIENCFKHGTSDMLEKPWINIQLNLQGQSMQLKIINGKAMEKKEQPGGIGIDNVRRRLQLLYPEKHQLNILEEEEVYIVNLTMQLTTPQLNNMVLTPQENVYAGI